MVHDEHPGDSDAPRAPDAKEATPELDPFPADPWELVPGEVASIGEYLKKQRQLRGISQEELCLLTRIPPRSLERLESGAFDKLDDGFVRGFVRTVADALGLDPDDTLARMSAEPDASSEPAYVVPGPGLMRVGILVAALALVLVSVGLVRTALDAFPDPQDTMATVIRTDPVRALAEEAGVADLTTTEILVPDPERKPRSLEADGDEDGAPARPVVGPIMRADALTDAASGTGATAVP